ncbi:unnamed protein product [Citrullus colocynthis]|uniref:SMAX1-like nucleotide binding domain-containing protein n=1 Tax=Citrullus colocynthis TaxID=252529 RepID=A0ABP0YQR9_9ROSI
MDLDFDRMWEVSKGAVKEAIRRVEKSQVPKCLKGVKFTNLSLSSFRDRSRVEVDEKVMYLKSLIRSCTGKGQSNKGVLLSSEAYDYGVGGISIWELCGRSSSTRKRSSLDNGNCNFPNLHEMQNWKPIYLETLFVIHSLTIAIKMQSNKGNRRKKFEDTKKESN